MISTQIMVLAIIAALLISGGDRVFAAQSPEQQPTHLVEPGDTWSALSIRYATNVEILQRAAGIMNRQSEPAIGSTIALPDGSNERAGAMIRSNTGGLLQAAARAGQSAWRVALSNGLGSPFAPSFYQPLAIADDIAIARDYPVGLASLEVARLSPSPGEALAVRAVYAGVNASEAGIPPVLATLNKRTLSVYGNGERFIALGATGAFFGSGRPEMRIKVGDAPVWAQPWRFVDLEWTVEDLYLTGAAADIDQEAIDAERQRLNSIWLMASPAPQWSESFARPISDRIPVSGLYGARRSYNGGPYNTYHEGVDFSAPRGTDIVAPARGTVVLAEILYVRGGSVIIDHGLGIYSGYYHLSDISVTPGQVVAPGDRLGGVGTTGLSTGNHLHWDLLINAMNVDAARWVEFGTDCWVLEGLGQPCAAVSATD